MLIGVFVMVFIAHGAGWLRLFEDAWIALVDVEHVAGYRMGLRLKDALGITRYEDVRAENKDLQNERNDLLIENARLRSSIELQEELKKQLSALAEQQWTVIPSRVLSRQESGDMSTLLIDRGRKHGIAEGQAVIAGEAVLVGTILSTEDTTAHVLLTTSSLSKLSVKLQNSTSTPGVLEGERDLSVNINLIPQGEVVDPGTTIVTSGENGGVPQGVVVGTVDQRSSLESELFQSARVRLLLDYSRLTILTVIQQ